MDISRFLPGGQLSDSKLNIGFLVGGGMGDILIFCNYLFYFCKKFKTNKITIEVIVDPNKNMSQLFLIEGELADILYDHPRTTEYYNNYDLFIRLTRYPDVVKRNFKKIKKYSPELLEYIVQCEKFKIINERHFLDKHFFDGQGAFYSELFGIKRIQQPDIYNLLGIKEEFKYSLPLDHNAREIIDELNLSNKKFITIHRGCDIRHSSNSTKMWSLNSYNKLVKMIKENFPEIKIIQIGVSIARCGVIEGVDINLTGMTSIKQVAALLRFGLVHIDNEGGMVHLRHAIHGGASIVLFGPTSDKFFGYSENYNIRGKGCPLPCEWTSKDWNTHCLRECSPTPCMHSITPNMVMKEVARALSEGSENEKI